MNTDREILLDGNLNKKTSKFCCHKEKPKPVKKKLADQLLNTIKIHFYYHSQ